MRYELWKNEDDFGAAWTFMPVDHRYETFLKYKSKFEPHSKMVWCIEAETREEAINPAPSWIRRTNSPVKWSQSREQWRPGLDLRGSRPIWSAVTCYRFPGGD